MKNEHLRINIRLPKFYDAKNKEAKIKTDETRMKKK